MNFGAHSFLWTLAFVWCKQTQIFKYLLFAPLPMLSLSWVSLQDRHCQGVGKPAAKGVRKSIKKSWGPCNRTVSNSLVVDWCIWPDMVGKEHWSGNISDCSPDRFFEMTKESLRTVCFLTNGHARQCMCSSQRNDVVQFLLVQERRAMFASWYLMTCQSTKDVYLLKAMRHDRVPLLAGSDRKMRDKNASLTSQPRLGSHGRLACFRDDIIFFIYIYQRWKCCP